MIGSRKKLTVNQQVHNPTQSSPTKASVLIQTDCSDYIHELSARKENIETCLQLFRVRYEKSQPQKCIYHIDDYLTLYCKELCKLLCVNCLYGSTEYTKYNVVPISSSLDSIRDDNQKNFATFTEECKKMVKTQKQLHQNYQILDEQYRNVVKDLELEFERMYALIRKKHEEIKNKAIQFFSDSMKNNEISRKEISWRKDFLLQYQNNLPRLKKTDQETEIYKHLVINMLLSEPIETEKLTYQASKEEMNEEFLKEARDMSDMLHQYLQVDKSQRSYKSSNRLRF